MWLDSQDNEFHPGYIAGQVYPLHDGYTNTSSAIAAADAIYLFPFTVPRVLNFASIKMRVQTAGAGSSAKTAIWANSPISHRPLGSPLFVDNTGVTTQASTTTVTTGMAAGTLTPNNIYWFGSKYTGTLPVMWNANLAGQLMWLTGGATAGAHHSFADAYANDMPTFTEGASFNVTTGAVPFPFAQT